MDSSGFSFILMVKGIKDFISSQVRKQKGTFENNWGNRTEEFEVYGKTVYTFVYASDTKEKAKELAKKYKADYERRYGNE